MLSQQAQAYCIQNGLNFLDLAGNIFIDVPGKLNCSTDGKAYQRSVGSGIGRPTITQRVLRSHIAQFTRAA